MGRRNAPWLVVTLLAAGCAGRVVGPERVAVHAFDGHRRQVELLPGEWVYAGSSTR